MIYLFNAVELPLSAGNIIMDSSLQRLDIAQRSLFVDFCSYLFGLFTSHCLQVYSVAAMMFSYGIATGETINLAQVPLLHPWTVSSYGCS